MALPFKDNIYRNRQMPRSDAVLMGRAELLMAEDRDLIEAIFILGQSTEVLGRMQSVSPRQIRTRAHRLAKRLTSRRFLDAARALSYMAKPDAKLAQRRFCQGATHRQLCHEFDLTCHGLRRTLDRISAEIATISRMRHAGVRQG